MVLGVHQILGFDPFPFPLLLLLGNIVQLLLGFVILVGQRTLGQAGDRRVVEAAHDHQQVRGHGLHCIR